LLWRVEHVEILALTTAQIHWVKRTGARKSRPTKLHRVDITPPIAVGPDVDEPPDAPASRGHSSILDTKRTHNALALPSLVPYRHHGCADSKVTWRRGPRNLSK
jgi:hypothetical protein